jgi:putative ABC transport system permease protein
VGVIGDVKQGRLEEDAAPEVYAPAAQMLFGSMFVVIRTEMAASSIVAPARREVAAVDKSVPIYHVKSLDAYFAEAAALPRFVALLVSSFAALALLLACLGVYGVVSYVVARRTHEIGIRMALGAGRGEIRRWVLTRAALLALLGASIGVAASFGMAQVLARLLYGVSSADPATFAISPLALVAAATLASYLPARRAMRVDPMVALRHE